MKEELGHVWRQTLEGRQGDLPWLAKDRARVTYKLFRAMADREREGQAGAKASRITFGGSSSNEHLDKATKPLRASLLL